MAVNSVSSNRQAVAADDRQVSQKREVAKETRNDESDSKARRAQDDDKGNRVDTEA